MDEEKQNSSSETPPSDAPDSGSASASKSCSGPTSSKPCSSSLSSKPCSSPFSKQYSRGAHNPSSTTPTEKVAPRSKPRQVPAQTFPIIIILCIGYASYAYCSAYCWNKVPRGKAISLICVYCGIVLATLLSWFLTYISGPGKVTDSDVEGEPSNYMCDPQGYRQYCSMCKRIKPDRAHHSAVTGTCVPRMDHYCGWLATVVGEKNYRFFLQTVVYFWILNVYILITQLIYAHSADKIIAHNIVLYVVCGMYASVLTTFIGAHCKHTIQDMTTIEHMNYRQGIMPIFNIEVNCQRVVIRLDRTDVVSHGPYSRGGYKNWLNTMGPNIFYWFLPLPWYPKHFCLNDKLLSDLKERYLTGKEGYLAFTQTGRWAPEHLDPPQLPKSVGHSQQRSQTSFWNNVISPFVGQSNEESI